MTLTRANVEVILVKRTENFLAAADMDSTTVNGTNADLNDPIGYAIRICEGTVSDITDVADADVQTVDEDDVDKLLDVAELRVLETFLSQYDKFGLKVGPRSEYQSQLAERLESKVKRMQKRLDTMYGVGAATIEAGVVGLDFAEHNEDLPTS